MNDSEGNSGRDCDKVCDFRCQLQAVIEFVYSKISSLCYINGCFDSLIKLILIQNYCYEVKKIWSNRNIHGQKTSTVFYGQPRFLLQTPKVTKTSIIHQKDNKPK